MDSASSSKVTVEYHDPSGVFPLVSRDIATRLPLRNLNWQTPTRPLRQIRQLHVEFVPDSFTETTLRPPVQRFDSNGPTSFDIVRSGKDGRKEAVKERRHQIPGLKTSPYLKVYVLRCDDKDAYKSTERGRIRQWLRDEVQGDGKHGENHDAFEWLILHVVVPDTVAASEARWRESKSEPDELKERKTSNVKFPGKSTRTVFDRLRADFNESSKTGQDRVSQIRLFKNNVPPDLLPTPAVAETLEETPQERELSWKDLMDKFKVLILGPFDARVRQYEADIAGQEARRQLPGWNFCTFFIHKEGLAKALESIGLVEDALAIYDELSVGLETIVRDIASGQAEGTATTFASSTNGIEVRVLGKLKNATNGVHNDKADFSLFSSDLSYREKIVRSDISVFDFFCYLFSRQKALILRLAGTRASRAELGATYNAAEGGEDLVLISEVCWRASSFIHNNARTLRQDLLSRNETPSATEVEALVCSWTYAMAEQILSDTASPLLELAQPEVRSLPNGVPNAPKRADFSFAMGASPYPQRMSSLGIRKSAPELQRPPQVSRDSLSSPPSSAGTDIASKGAGIPGLPELTTYRAELIMLQRKMIELLAGKRGWRAGWAVAKHAKSSKLESVSLDEDANKDETGDEVVNGDAKPKVGAAIAETETPGLATLPSFLSSALESEADFHDAYQSLSDRAMRYYALATQNKSVEAIVGDLAMLKRQQGDYATAADYLKHLLPSYATDGWSAVEAEVLSIYAECLKRLDKQEEYAKTVLDLLAKVCGRKMAKSTSTLHAAKDCSLVNEDESDVSGLLSEVCWLSNVLSSELARLLEDYFGDVELEHEIMHLEDRDGFALRLRFRHVLADELQLDQVSARLTGLDDANQEIWMVSDGSVVLKPGVNELDLETTTNAFGAFSIDSLVFKAGKVRFSKEFAPKTQPTLRLNDDDLSSPRPQLDAHKQPLVFVYPAERAFDLGMTTSSNIFINKPRHLEIKLSSGWNDIQSVDIRMKPTSAGLRLHLADAEYEGIGPQKDESGRPGKLGQLSMAGLAAHSSAMVKLPYTVEHAISDISMRLEVYYHTAKGSFTYLTSVVLRHELPLDVDVDDIFHMDTLFSSFTIRTVRGVPIVITETDLRDSPVYAVGEPPFIAMPMTVFDDRSPAKLIYKISRKALNGGKLSKRDAALALKMRYFAVDELLRATLLDLFMTSLAESGYAALSRLLLPIIAERSKELFHGTDILRSVLHREAQMPSFEDLGWKDVVQVLPAAARSEVGAWLQKWHDDHQRILIDYETEVAGKVQRQITIAVDVPTVDFIFDARMELDEGDLLMAPNARVLTLGKPVRAEVQLDHSDDWSEKSIYGQKRSQDASFLLDIHAEPDTWLIGGPRRMHFTPASGECKTVGLTLIPLKVGKQTLPSIDVLPEAQMGGEGKPTGQRPVTCETHYENVAETVEVIRDVRMTRIHVMETSAAAAAAATGSRPSTADRTVSEPG